MIPFRKHTSNLSFAFLLCIFAINFNLFAQVAGDYRSAATGNWSNAANWDRWNGSSWVNNPAEGYPGQAASTNAVDIQHNITLDVSPANVLASLAISQPSISLTIANNTTARTLSVTGNIVISGDNSYIAVGAYNATHTLNVGGIINLAGANTYVDLYTAASQVCNLVFNANTLHSIGGASPGVCQFNNITISANCNTLTAGIALDLEGTMTINTGSTFDASSYTHTIYGAWANSGTFTCSTSTITFNGGNQTITPGGSAFNNVNFYGANTKTLAGTITINGNCDISGSNLTDAGFQITGNASGTFNLDAGRTLTLGTAASATSFPTGFVSPNVTLNATSTVNYNSSLAQTISAVAGYGNLTLTTTLAVIKTVANNLTVNGTLTISANNTLADAGYTINCLGAVTVAGTHTGAGKIQLTGATTPQNISGAGSLNNVEFAKSAGTARITSAFTINGDITVTSAAFTLNGQTLTTSGDIDVASGATFTVNSNAILKVANGKTITNQGTCSFTGAAGTPATLTINGSGTFSFTQSAATAILTARYYGFEYCNLTISNGTISASPNNLSNGTFSNGTGNEYINFDGYASSVSPSLITFNSGPTYNIRKTSGAGVITISGAAGSLAGESYDQDDADPGTLIIWSTSSTYYSQGTGNFSTLSNWNTIAGGGGSNPVAADLTSGLNNFIIQSTHTITVDQNVDFYDMTIQNGGTLTIGNNTTNRTVTSRNNFTVDNGGTVQVGASDATHTVNFYGNLTINGTFDLYNFATQIANSSFYSLSNPAISGTPTSVQFNNITIQGSVTLTAGFALDIEGNVVLNANSEFISGNYTHTIAGNWTGNATGTHTSTGKIKFDGANQTIAGVASFYNLELAGTGTKTISTGVITVDNDFIISGSGLTVTSNQIINIAGKYSVTGTSATITPSGAINITGNLEVSGTPTIWGGTANTTTVTGNLVVSNNSSFTIGGQAAVKTINVIGNVQVDAGSTIDAGAYTATHAMTINGNLTVNGTLDFYTAAGQVCNLAFNSDVAHAINGTPTAIQLNRLTFNATSNTTTANYALDIEENVVFSASSSFNSGNYTHTIAGNWTGNATGTHTSTGTIKFDGGNQTIAGAAFFYNIELAGTGIKTISTGTITVGNDFIVSASSLTVTSNQVITISGKYSVTGNSATITPSGTINITGNLEISGTPTIWGGTANTNNITGNLLVTNNSTFTIGGQAAVKTINITGDVQVDAGSTLNVGEYAATHLMTISGNLLDNGVFDMVGSVATYICNVTFIAASNKNISGTGATCDFNAITVNKGSDINSILDVQRVITITDRTTAGGNLTLTNGTFKLSSASTLKPYYGAATICSATARLWLNNAGANVSCAGAGTTTTPGTPTVTGTLQVTAGTFEYGSGNDLLILTAATAALIIDGAGGIVKLYGGLNNNGTGALTISNGNLIIDCQRSDVGGDDVNTAVYLVDLRGVISFTGGTMTIVDPIAYTTSSNNATALMLWTLDGSDNFNGSTIQFGDGISTTSGGSSDGFDIRTNNAGTYYLGNIVVNNTTGTNRQVKIWNGDGQLYVGGNLTINSGTSSEFDVNGRFLYLKGNLTNNGTFNTSTASSTLIMTGTSQQTISGTGTFTTGTAGRILNFTVDNSSGANPGVDLQCPLTIQTAYTLTNGSLNTSGAGVLTLGIGAASTLTITRTNGSLLATPTWNLSGVTCNVTYNTATGAITTSNELPGTANGNIATLNVNNASVVLLNNADITVATSLTLTAGEFNLQNNLLNITGTITRNGTTQLGTLSTGTGASIKFANAGILTIPLGTFTVSPVEFSNLIINPVTGVTLPASQDITLRGTLTLTTGVFTIGANTLTFHTHDTPIIKTVGTITTAAGSSIAFGKTGSTGGNAFAIPSGTFTATPSITNFTVNRDNKLTLGNQNLTLSGTLTLTKGEFDNNGLAFTTTGAIPFARTAGTLTVGAAGSLIFNANASNCTLPDGLFTSAPATFANLTMNRGAGVLVTLGNQEIYVTGTTTLTAGTGGILEIKDADLQITTLAGVQSNTSMIVTNGTGYLKKYFNTGATAASTFPVGDNTGNAEYSRAVITVSANATAGTIGVKVTDAKHPNNSESDNYITRYWSFSAPALTTYTYSTVFTYPSADTVGSDEVNFKMQRYDNGTLSWTPDMASNTVPGANSTLTTSSLTETTGKLDNNDFTSYSCSNIYYWSKVTGNWNGAGTWEVTSTPVDPGVGSGTPTTVAPTYNNNKGITIRSATNVTVNAGTYTADQLTVAGTLTLGANTLNIYNGTGTDVVINGTITATTGQLLAVQVSDSIEINGTLTTTDLDGLNIDANSTISTTNTPSLTLGSSSTINFGGAATQKVDSRTDYANLSVTAAGQKDAQGAITVNNNLTIATGTFADGGYTITVKGNVTSSGTHSGAGKILLSGSTGGHTIGGTNYNNIELNDVLNASLNVATTINGDLTISSGTLNATGYALTVASSKTTTVNGTFTATNATGTKTFGNLIVNGTLDNSGNVAVTINGNLTVNTGATFTAGTGTYTLSGAGNTIDGTISALTLGATAVSGSYTNQISTLSVSGNLSGAGTLTQSANCTLNITGNATITTLNVAASPNTVEYNGAGAQTIKGTTYHHLICSTGGAKTLGAAVVTNANFTVNTGASFDPSSYDFTVSGSTLIAGTFAESNAAGTDNLQNVELNGGTMNGSATGIMNILGNLNVINGDGTIGRMQLTVTGTTTVSGSRTLTFSSATGSKTFNNNIDLTGTINYTAAVTTTLNGNLIMNAGSLISGSATGVMNVSGTLTANTGGISTIGVLTTTVTGVSTIDGVLAITSATGTKTLGDLTVNGTWNNSGNSAITVGGNLTVNSGATFTAGTGVYTFSGAGKSIDGTITSLAIPSLTVTGTCTNNVNELTVSTALAGVGGLTNAANKTLYLSGTSTITTLTATAIPNTVEYNGAGAQTIKGTTYHNLNTSNSNTKTLGAATIVNNNLSVGSGTTFNPSTLNLTVSGTSSIDGTFTESSATGTDIFVGKVTINLGGTWNFTVAETPEFRGGLEHNGATVFTSGTGAYTFSTNDQNISGNTAIVFNGAVSISGAITVTNTNSNVAGITFNSTLNGTAAGSIFDNRGIVFYPSNAATQPMNTGVLTADYNSNTFYYSRTGAQTIKTASAGYYNLAFSGSGTKTVGTATVINGDFTIGDGTTFDPANFGVIVQGDWINNNTVASAGFTEGSGTVTFSGSGAQSITHAGGTETFYNLTTANNGNTVTMNSNVIVSNRLDFTTSGYIALNTKDITISNWNNGDIPTLGIDRFVIVDQTGYFKVTNVASGQTVNFPIGLATGNANYARVDILNGSGGASDFDINLCDYVNDVGTCSGGTEYTTQVIDYSWNIVSACNNAIVTIYWDASKEMPLFDRANMCLAHYTGGTWARLLAVGSATNFSGTVYYFSDVTTSFSKFAGEKENGPLPIELLSFKANCDKNKVNIEWTTATETGNDYFTIEKGRDTDSWSPLAEVDGAGDSYNVINYLYVDKNPYTDVNYYRLKQTDFDGKYSYSDPVSAYCYINSNNLEINKITFDNDILTITLNSDKGGLHHFNLYDYSGKMIINENITTDPGNNVLTYNIPSMSDGVYVLTIYNNSKSVTKKILIQ